MTDFERFIKELIKDYFTANIKAEVPIDTLITPIIPNICREKLGETVLLTKEMPIVKEKRSDVTKNSRSLSCCNADFVLLSKQQRKVYIVELKTSETSENEKQLIYYKDSIKNQCFKVLLLDLFDILYRHSLNGKYNNLKKGFADENLIKLVESILEVNSADLRKGSTIKSLGDKEYNSYTEGAEIYLKENEIHRKNKDSSEKYLMTAARLLDALECVNISLKEIAEYNMDLVYILPSGVTEIPNVTNINIEMFEPVDEYGKVVKGMFSKLWSK